MKRCESFASCNYTVNLQCHRKLRDIQGQIVETFELWLFVERTLWKKMMPFRVTSHQKLKPSCSPVNSGFYRWVSDSRWRWFQLPRAGPSTETTTTKCTCYLVDLEGTPNQDIHPSKYICHKIPSKWWKMIPQYFSKAPVSPLSAAISPLTWQPGSHERSHWVRLQLLEKDMTWDDSRSHFKIWESFLKWWGWVSKKNIKRIKKKY